MNFYLADIFTDHMVLQRNKNFPIWGWGVNDTVIQINFCNETIETKVKNGEWIVSFSPKEAGGPYLITINNQVYIKDVYIGDVFIAGGQSNMEFPLSQDLNGRVEVEHANYPKLRYYNVPRVEFEESDEVKEYWDKTTSVNGSMFAKRSKSHWKICSPETAGSFSAVAYYFVKYLDTQVPIGIIGCNWGATSASCWMSKEAILQDDELKQYYEEDKAEEIQKKLELYKQKMREYQEDLKCYLLTFTGDKPSEPARPAFHVRLAGLYNTMLKKITPFAVKAVLWYQGESDTNHPRIYRKLFTTMIMNWRNVFQDKDLPFLFVQLAAFYNWDAKSLNWPLLREAQFLVAQSVKNTGMVVAIDCGEQEQIHPINKEPVGYRLALLAKHKLYKQDICFSGPIFKEMKIELSKIRLTFDFVGDHFVIIGNIIKGFKICGDSQQFKIAEAFIEGKDIFVYHQEIIHPIHVRYGFDNYCEVNVYNNSNLPLCPFRTDDYIL